jgi:hypothetical protein
MKWALMSFLLLLLSAGAGSYALDHGIYVGTTLYRWGPAPCCPEMGADVVKRCRYLFVTGISETTAQDGLTQGDQPPFKGYCTLFAK